MADKKYTVTLAGQNHLSSMFKATGKDSDQLTGKLRKQEQELKKLNRSQRDLSAYSGQKRELKALGGELAKAKMHTEKLAKEIAASGVVTRKQQREFQRAKKRSDALTGSYKKLQGSTHQLSNKLRDAGVSTGRMEREQERLRLTAQRTTKILDKQRASVKALAKAQRRIDAADARMGDVRGKAVNVAMTAAAMAVPVVRAMKAESATAEIAKVVDFDSKDERNQFQQQLHRQAAGSGQSYEDAAAIAAAAGQSGIEKSELLGFTSSATKMAIAFDMEAGAAGETMAAWRAGMGLTMESTVQLADAVNHVSNNMNAKAADISGVLKRQGAVAMASGLSEQQSASLAGALLSGGATQEVASTTMKNLLGALTKGDAATGSQKDALSSLGFDASAMAGDMQTDAVGTITELFAALSDAPIEEQSALVSQLFGEESKGGIVPLLKNQALLQKAFGLTADASKYAGAMAKEYAGVTDTSGHKSKIAGQQIDRLVTVVGGALLPAASELMEFVGWAAGGLADFAVAHETTTKAVVYGAAALVTYKVGQLALMYGRGKLNQMEARAAMGQAKLAAAEGQTVAKANLAAGALTRLNRTLGVTTATSKMGKAGKYGAAAGAAGAVVMGGLAVSALMDDDDERNNAAKGRDVGSAGGAMAGMAAGAALGSVVPVIGTAIGGAIGGAIGYSLGTDWGGDLGEWIGGMFDDDKVSAPGSDAINGAPQVAKLESTVNLNNLPPNANARDVAQEVVNLQREQLMPMLEGPGARIDNSLEVAG